MSIKFSDACFYDFNDPQSLELAVRRSATFAGVHKFDFESAIDEGFDDLTDWTVDDGIWSAVANQLNGQGNGTAFWRYLEYNTSMPPSFVATFHFVSGTKVGFYARKNVGTREALLVWWDATHTGAALVAADGSTTELIVQPFGITAPSWIQIAYSWRYDRLDKDLKWLCMSLFADGVCMLSAAYEVVTDWSGDGIGFAAFNAEAFVVEQFRIARFARIAEYLSIDPGETPGQGLARAIQSTRILYMCRFDGTMRVWAPGNRESVAVVTNEHEFRMLTRKDRKTITHVRVIGAINALDAFNNELGTLYMHQFQQVDNAYLMSDEETAREAALILNDMDESKNQYQFVIAGNPVLEAHDVITHKGVAYRIQSINTTMQGQENGGAVYTTTILMRDYYAV